MGCGLEQGKGTDDVGNGHRRAAVRSVLAARNRAVNQVAGSGQIDGVYAIVAESGEIVVLRRRGDDDNIGEVVAARIDGSRVNVIAPAVGTAVAGRDHENVPGLPRCVDGVVQRLTVRPAGPAIVADFRRPWLRRS